MLSAAKANRQYFRKAYGTGKHGWAAEDPSPYAARFLARLKWTIPGVKLFGRQFEPLEMVEENGGRHGFWHVLFKRLK